MLCTALDIHTLRGSVSEKDQATFNYFGYTLLPFIGVVSECLEFVFCDSFVEGAPQLGTECPCSTAFSLPLSQALAPLQSCQTLLFISVEERARHHSG